MSRNNQPYSKNGHAARFSNHLLSQGPLPLKGHLSSAMQPRQLRDPNFSVFFGAFLLLTLGICIAALLLFYSAAYRWILMVEPGLALLLWLTTGIMYWTVDGSIPRSILAVTNLTASMTGLALLVLDSQNVRARLGNLLPLAFPYQDISHSLLTISLTAAGLISFYWLLRPSTLMRNFVLFVSFEIAVTCALLQTILLYTDGIRHILLLIALTALIEGLLVVACTENVTSVLPLLEVRKQLSQFLGSGLVLRTIPLQAVIEERAEKNVKDFVYNITLLMMNIAFLSSIIAIIVLASYPIFKIAAFVILLLALSHILSAQIKRIQRTKQQRYLSATQILQAIKKRPVPLEKGKENRRHLNLIKKGTTSFLCTLRTRSLKEDARK